MIAIECTNNGLKKEYPLGTSLTQIAEDMQLTLNYPILAARVNNVVKSMHYEIYKKKVVTFIDASDPDGFRVYERSLYFILYKAVKELYPGQAIVIKHSISGGKYCEFEDPDFVVTAEIAATIEQRMREIVAEDLPFKRKEVRTEEAIQLFEKEGLYSKRDLVKSRNQLYASVYKLGNCLNYFYGFLAPSTGYINVFGVKTYENGLLLITPANAHPDRISKSEHAPKLFAIFNEFKTWNKVLGISYLNDINRMISEGKGTEMLLVSEALQEKKVVQVADHIAEKGDVKIVLLSGPSSSGKTTTSKRISVQLGVLGYHPVSVSMDNYFVERDQTPIDKNGKTDFEHLNAVDLDLFNSQMDDLIHGREVQMPTFDFQHGTKVWKGDKMRLNSKSILVIEGIHALNPALLPNIPQEQTFRLFTSALTTIAIDRHNPIPTTDNRLIRRIIRDSRYRGYSAENTILRWNSVRSGESKWIFPYQENADEMFNSAICCELNIFKPFALQQLYQVPEASPAYSEARRLMKLLEYFTELRENDVPQSSILREFFGGSVFKY